MTERHSDFKNSASFSANNECGFVYVLIASWALILFIFASFTIDAGRAWYEQRTIHVATDAAALSAAALLPTNPSGAANYARMFAAQNGLTTEEIDQGGGIVLGHWDWRTRTFSTSGTQNAIRVYARRNMATQLASSFGWRQLRPVVHSTAMGGGVTCLVPLGIEKGIIDAAQAQGSDRIIVTSTGGNSGNWYKLNIKKWLKASGNEYNDFEKLVREGVCDIVMQPGDRVDSEPGNEGANGGGGGGNNNNQGGADEDTPNGVAGALATRIGDILLMPITSEFDNGSNKVDILGFIAARVIGVNQTDPGGNNWKTWDLVLDLIKDPNGLPPYVVARLLVE